MLSFMFYVSLGIYIPLVGMYIPCFAIQHSILRLMLATCHFTLSLLLVWPRARGNYINILPLRGCVTWGSLDEHQLALVAVVSFLAARPREILLAGSLSLAVEPTTHTCVVGLRPLNTPRTVTRSRDAPSGGTLASASVNRGSLSQDGLSRGRLHSIIRDR